jgi:hypothetical protein
MLAEYAAFKALLTSAVGSPAWPVYAADDPTLQTTPKPSRYLCVYDRTPDHRKPRLTGQHDAEGFTFSVMHVGLTLDEVRLAVERTRAALVRKVLLSKTTPLRIIDNGPLSPDPDSTVPRIYTATDVWRCVANNSTV